MKKSVFISYARKDRALLDSLCTDLEDLQCNLWFDEDQLNGGMHWWDQILDEIRRADLVLVVVSSASLASVACRRECDYAIALGKPILPVRVDGMVIPNNMPLNLQRVQMVDFFTGNKAEGFALANALRTIPDALPLPLPLPEPPEIPLSYTAELRQQLNSSESLGEREQALLLHRLRGALRMPHQYDDAVELLRIFRKRRDLLAVTAQDVDELLAQYGQPKTVERSGRKGWLIASATVVLLALVVWFTLPGTNNDANGTANSTSDEAVTTKHVLPTEQVMQARLLVSATPSGATLTIGRKDGSSSQSIQSGQEVELADGAWIIKASAKDYRDKEVAVQLEANDSQQRQSIELQPLPKTLQAGEERTFDGIKFVWIPPGEFEMGSPASEKQRGSNEQQHHVRIAEGFWLGKYEVTQSQWQSVMGSNPSSFKGSNNPVENVSWNDIQGYLKKLGNGYRLPTEAEWEYAARAGTQTPFHTGQCLSTNQGNYGGNYPYSACSKGENRQKTLPVGLLAHNDWNLYDMHGNVWEWTSSLYKDSYDGSELKGSSVSDEGSRVLRGGSWGGGAYGLRSAVRGYDSPSVRFNGFGFRLARSAPRQDN